MFTKSAPFSTATFSHSFLVRTHGLHESATASMPYLRLSAIILYANLYPSPRTSKEQNSRSPCSIVSIHIYAPETLPANSFARVDFPVAGNPENMYSVGFMISFFRSIHIRTGQGHGCCPSLKTVHDAQYRSWAYVITYKRLSTQIVSLPE